MLDAAYLQTANVRAVLAYEKLSLKEGKAFVGDVVAGEVIPTEGASVPVYSWQRGEHQISGPFKVIAVVGNRQSSTHVNGGIPPGGLVVANGREVSWIGGESGLVGELLWDSAAGGPNNAETSLSFRLHGLVVHDDDSGKTLNIAERVDRSKDTPNQLPIIAVAASSSEAGKTTLSSRLIKCLTAMGHKVAALKVTGTAGCIDSMHHAQAGAHCVFDQVDAGLPTTYLPQQANENEEEEAKGNLYLAQQMEHIFCLPQQQGCTVIVAEWGGDLPWAGNPLLLQQQYVLQQLKCLVVICNDPMAALGTLTYVEKFMSALPAEKVVLAASPFRNYAGFAMRVNKWVDQGSQNELLDVRASDAVLTQWLQKYLSQVNQ